MDSAHSILEKLRELRPMLQKEYGVQRIGLFGSYADGSQNPESDVDLLVELEQPIGWKFFSLELLLEELFQRDIDLVTPDALREPLKERILKQVQYA